MGGIKAGGAEVFIGITGSGKTTLAQRRQYDAAMKWHLPRATLDLEGAQDWSTHPHAKNADEVLDSLYVKRTTARVWTPKDERERAKFFMAVGYWGGVACLIDGLPMIADAHNFEEEFRKMLYRHRHGQLQLPAFHYLVAQRASLVHRHVFAACRWVFVFKQAPGVDARRIHEEFDIPPETSTKLERGAHVPILLGFPEKDDASSGSNETPPSSPSGGGGKGGAPGENQAS